MSELFVKKSIEIIADPSIVWRILIEPEFTSQWIGEFGIKNGSLSSEWQIGAEVLWCDETGKLLVGGKVTDIELRKFIHFTVIDQNIKIPNMTDKDGITYLIKNHDDTTTLSIEQGDFGKIKDGEKYFNMTDNVWEKVLPKIKSLAEKIQ
jgi:uncharacterized protein YndB with AHSA1/START domain